MKNHPGKAPPPSARDKTAKDTIGANSNPTYSATVGSVTSQPHNCSFCHKQYATNAKLLQHQRKEHQGDHNYNQKRGQMSPMGAPASGASRDSLDIETGQVSGRLVTISGKYRFYFFQVTNSNF